MCRFYIRLFLFQFIYSEALTEIDNDSLLLIEEVFSKKHSQQKKSLIIYRKLEEILYKSKCLLEVYNILQEVGKVSSIDIIYTFFTPQDNVAGIISKLILMPENEQIYVMAYGMTCPIIISSLLQFVQTNPECTLHMLVDKQYYNKVYLDNLKIINNANIMQEKLSGIAHNKIIIICRKDGSKILITGSFNFTNNAQRRNAENIVIFVCPEDTFIQEDEILTYFIKNRIEAIINLYILNFQYRLKLPTTT